MTREEAIKELKILKEDYWDDDSYGHETKQYENTILAIDMAIQTLEQERSGYWIEHFDESGKWCECDQCHTDWGGSVNFCPNCGADMGGGKR